MSAMVSASYFEHNNIVRALTTIEQMLRDRGEAVDETEPMSDEHVRLKLGESNNPAFVTFRAGKHDLIFFTRKLKTADIAKAAEEVDDERKADAILVVPDTLMTVHARSVASHFGPNVEVFTLAALSVNISRSVLVPRHELLLRSQHASLKGELGVGALSQLPLIESTDPMAMYVRARPGDVVKITRLHPSAGTQVAYRYCRK